MADIVLIGTFHYPDRFDVFSHDVQNQINEFTNRLASFHPNKIAVEFPHGMQNELDKLYARSDKHSFVENMVYGNVERYGAGVQTLIRPSDAPDGQQGVISGITWYREGFTNSGTSSMTKDAVKNDEEGRILLTLVITWDGSTYSVTINDVAAPQAVIDYMNQKWGGNDSEA